MVQPKPRAAISGPGTVATAVIQQRHSSPWVSVIATQGVVFRGFRIVFRNLYKFVVDDCDGRCGGDHDDGAAVAGWNLIETPRRNILQPEFSALPVATGTAVGDRTCTTIEPTRRQHPSIN